MKVCEYFLPCGRCDKFNKSCDLTVKDLENYQIMMGDTTPETKSECDHDWYFDSRMMSMGVEKEKYVCNKCGKVKWIDGIWLK